MRQNGRITIMFCSFERTPNIVRFYGRGRVVSLYDDEYAEWAGRFPPNPGARSVIVIHVERVSDSCAYSLQLMSLDEERDILTPNMGRRGPAGIVEYPQLKNPASTDGLPAYDHDGCVVR